MKVLQIVKTTRGATWALNQAAYLKKLGVEMVTALPNDTDGSAVKYKELGLEVVVGNWSLPVTKPWKIFSRKKEINRLVKEVNPDLIHFHFVTNVIMGRLALHKDKTPRLFQVPGPVHLQNWLTNFAERVFSTDADYWAGACNKSCKIYKSKGIPEDKVFLAYYGVPQENKEEACGGNVLHDEYNIPKDKKIIAMVCYFYKPKRLVGETRGYKGHEDFFDAMKIVMDKYDNVVPVIVGNAWTGSEKYAEKVKRYAKKRLGDRVIFTGFRSDIYNIYPEISLAVHPSLSENLGGAAESLMLGVPTISTSVGGFLDIVIPGETGCLAEPRNPKDLAEKIEWALEHEDEMKKMAKNGQKLVSEMLDLNNTSKQVYNIYGTILNRS